MTDGIEKAAAPVHARRRYLESIGWRVESCSPRMLWSPGTVLPSRSPWRVINPSGRLGNVFVDVDDAWREVDSFVRPTEKDSLEINIPFQGFYNSWYSDEIEHTESQDIQFRFGDEQERMGSEPDSWDERCENARPEHERLDVSEASEIYWRHTDYSIIYAAVARAYVDAFDLAFAEKVGFPLGLEFVEMTSPREYNFETDRIFCRVPRRTVARLFRLVKRGDALRETIAERHTSRSGFISFYDNDLANWLAKPLSRWDHNELGTLLRAVLALVVGNDDNREFEWDVYYRVIDCDGLYHEWESGVDWPALEASLEASREEKREAWRADHPEPVKPYRCDETGDMLARDS